MLFNNLDEGVECAVSKFVEDTKRRGAIDSLEGQEALLGDPDRLEHCAMINEIKFNKTKCWTLHLGQSNKRHEYKFGEEWLEVSPAEEIWGCWLTVGSMGVSNVPCQPRGQTASWSASNTR